MAEKGGYIGDRIRTKKDVPAARCTIPAGTVLIVKNVHMETGNILVSYNSYDVALFPWEYEAA